jgi:MFS family permease
LLFFIIHNLVISSPWGQIKVHSVHKSNHSVELDRGNIANALTDNFFEDVGITQNQFNVGQQMLSLGIVLFEIPSNMILYRVGPGKWLTLQLFLFGTVSTFQAFMNNYGSFVATRFLLGITESGFIPGGLWTLSTWYTRKETAKRVMFFYFGNQFGQASSKLLAYGILHMRGVGDKAGWYVFSVLYMSMFLILTLSQVLALRIDGWLYCSIRRCPGLLSA